MSWTIRTEPWEELDDQPIPPTELQRSYGSGEKLIDVLAAGEGVMFTISITELLDDLGPRYLIAHVFNACRNNLADRAEITGAMNMAGEIACYGHSYKTPTRHCRKRK